MKTIEFNSRGWVSRDDLFDALLPLLGAPDWHGRNLDALWDSIVGGDINEMLPPYTIKVHGVDMLPSDLRAYLDKVAALFSQARTDEGIQVFFELD